MALHQARTPGEWTTMTSAASRWKRYCSIRILCREVVCHPMRTSPVGSPAIIKVSRAQGNHSRFWCRPGSTPEFRAIGWAVSVLPYGIANVEQETLHPARPYTDTAMTTITKSVLDLTIEPETVLPALA